MPYLMNAWYAAAWSQELASGGLLARTFLGQPVVLFRNAQGQTSALADVCPHRFAPLSRGRLVDGAVQCGYHGLTFDASGACVHNPQTPGQTPNRTVRSYPIVERQSIIWIWMGDAATAEPASMPDYPDFDAEGRTPVRGHSIIPGHYLLAVDNLLDLSHPEFLHEGSLGSPAMGTANYEVKIDGPRIVHSNRWFLEGPIPPALERNFETDGKPVEHWVNMKWEAPANLSLMVGVTFTGRPRDEGQESFSGHFLTPETETSTHYFWSSVRQNALTDEEIGTHAARMRGIFEGEDSPMIAAVQSRMGSNDFWEMKPLLLPGDAGAARARRALEALIRDELGLANPPIPRPTRADHPNGGGRA